MTEQMSAQSSPPAVRLFNWAVCVGEDVMARYGRLVAKMPPAGLVFAILVFLLVFPLITIRDYHFEEGLTASLARDVLDGGNPWYVPFHYGVPWPERPVILSWIVAVLSMPFGEIYQEVVRLPVVLALYTGALSVYLLVKDCASRAAAVFAALCFLFSPLVLARVITAESDVMLTAVQFLAFLLWWRGYRAGRNELWRWALVGLLLGATALFKGPQPAGFFALGVGAFLLWRRDWRALPGYVLAGFISLGMVGAWYVAAYREGDLQWWISYMRLNAGRSLAVYVPEKIGLAGEMVANLLPGVVPAVVGLVGFRRFRPNNGEGRSSARELFLALLFFGVIGLVAALFWPGARPRYMAPALPAVAAMAGLVFDVAVSGWGRHLVRSTFAVLIGIMVYQGIWNWIVAPALPDIFGQARVQANAIRMIVESDPAPIHAQLRIADPILGYLHQPVQYHRRDAFSRVEGPAWVMAEDDWFAELLARRPDLVAEPDLRLKVLKTTVHLARVAPRR